MSQAPGRSPFEPRDSSDSMGPKPPPLYDPYLIPIVPARPRELSMLAVGSVLAALLLGPIGAVAAIFLGRAARRQVARSPRQKRGHTLATVGMVLGVVLAINWTAAAAIGVWLWRERRADVTQQVAQVPRVLTPPAPTAAPSQEPSAPQVKAPSASRSEPRPGGSVPKETITRREGAVTVVDVGVSAPSLSDELGRQKAEALSLGQTLVVMTTREPCEPCRGVETSLAHPLLQEALARVRLVRVDIDVFREDLSQLHIQRDTIPGFFLLAPDFTPRDGIDGGEWDEDIAMNIAPVLGSFVRGKFTVRRQPWRRGSGMML